MSRKRASPVRSPARQRNSRRLACGNFGAPLVPPLTGSMSCSRRSAAVSRSVRSRAIASPSGFSASRSMMKRRLAAILSGSSRKSRATSFEDIDERRAAVARGLREIGAAPDRLAAGRQEHGQRPAALLAERMQRRHVDLVDVGTLLAVDLDVDEQAVHHRRGRVVLEALVGHDVAPVAGGVADREQDRLVVARGLGERRLAPRAPVDRVVLVLEQVRARLVAEQVFGHRTGK